MKKDTLEYRMMLEHNRLKIPDSKLLTGSTKGKFPVVLDGGRTTIFISDESKESETREKYELRKDNRVNFYAKKTKS
ncbi:MAG: hypothetical protein NT004_00900 [Bacteroidetes bacterium]|nr:hypothetical protein [Bacteroidota bacterium]